MATVKSALGLSGLLGLTESKSKGGDENTESDNTNAAAAEAAAKLAQAEDERKAAEAEAAAKLAAEASVAPKDGTVASAADPEGARYVAPAPKRFARLRATTNRLYNAYQQVYFNTDKASLPVEIDSWNQCQIDAGLLVEVPEEAEAAKE